MHVCNEEGTTLDTTYNDEFYLRRAMGSQGALRQALLDVGMGYEAVGPEPVVPEYPGDEHWDGDTFPSTPLTEQARAYSAACEEFLKGSRDERPGIPVHKLCMNEGWWVTRIECATALQLWERAGQPIPEAFRDDVLPFLACAAKNGGFRVF